MAGKNEIRYRVGLDGDDEVNKKLDGVADHGKNAFKDVNQTIDKTGSGAGGSFEKIFDKVKDKFNETFAEKGGRGGRSEGGEGTPLHRVGEGLHKALDSAAEGAELSFGNKFSTVILAARAGVVGFIATLGGLVVGQLEKQGDETSSRVSRLSSFTGSARGGREAEESLGSAADKIRLSASELAPAHEQLRRASQIRPEAERLDEKGLQDVLKTATDFAKAGGLDVNKTPEPIAQLFKGLRENGGLTPDTTKALSDILPVLFAKLLPALQKNFPNAPGGFYPTPQVFGALQGLGPQAAQAAADAGTSIPNASSNLGRSVEKLAETISDGGHVIANSLNSAAKIIDDAATSIKTNKDAAKSLPPVSPEVANAIRAERGVEPVQGSQQYDFLRRPPSTQNDNETPIGVRLWQSIFGGGSSDFKAPDQKTSLPVAGVDYHGNGPVEKSDPAKAVSDLADGADHAADSLKKVAKSADQVAKDQAADRANLDRISAHDATQQAKLDYESKGEENAIKLGRDKIAVENAAIQKEQARIGLDSAQKGKSQASLAPETARENLEEAHVNENSARLRFLHSRGVYTEGSVDEARVRRDQRQEAARAYERSLTASKRAEIEDKYAYLEPQKADLAGKKAETDIRSADYLAKDSTLTLAKDEKGLPLSAEAAGLRYAQAQLTEQEAIAKFAGTEVELLSQILAKITGQSERDSQKSDEHLSRSADEQDHLSQSADKVSQSVDKFGEFSAQQYEREYRTNGIRTVEGDRLEREKAAPGSASNLGKRQDFETQSDTHYDVQESGDKAKAGELRERDDYARADTAIAGYGKRPRDLYDQNKIFGDQVQSLKEDFDSQARFNENIGRQNGGVQKSPPGSVSGRYPPPILGHYDPITQSFKPANPGNVTDFGAGGLRPNTNDYTFADRKNPAGQYQPGISTPLTFPNYNEDLRRNVFPQGGAPVPQPRPEDYYAAGGYITGPGSSDFGTNFMHAVRHFADGGGVESAYADANDDGSNKFGYYVDPKTGKMTKRKKRHSQFVGSYDPSDAANHAGGGHIAGPGTSTSDSIPAMLSHDEFVVNARETRRNLPLLNAINDGEYSDGGFVGRLAAIGFANGGLIDVPHLAVGGPASFSAAPKVDDGGNSSGSPLGHYSVDLRTNHGDFKMMAPGDVAQQMSRAAVNAASVQAGNRPSWYGK